MTNRNIPNAPLFRDPIYDGAADPVLVWNRIEENWWIFYTNRRANAPGSGYGWIHGTDIGIASSKDGSRTWLYRGIARGLNFEKGWNTFWAPEIIWHNGLYHMYCSDIHVQGMKHTFFILLIQGYLMKGVQPVDMRQIDPPCRWLYWNIKMER